jgi:hypothetical protein
MQNKIICMASAWQQALHRIYTAAYSRHDKCHRVVWPLHVYTLASEPHLSIPGRDRKLLSRNDPSLNRSRRTSRRAISHRCRCGYWWSMRSVLRRARQRHFNSVHVAAAQRVAAQARRADRIARHISGLAPTRPRSRYTSQGELAVGQCSPLWFSKSRACSVQVTDLKLLRRLPSIQCSAGGCTIEAGVCGRRPRPANGAAALRRRL